MNSVWPKKGIPWLPYERYAISWWEYIIVSAWRSSCGIKCLRSSSHRQAYTYFMRNSTVEWRILKEMAQIVLKRNRCEWFELPCFAKEKKQILKKQILHMVFCASVYRVAWMQHWSWGIICCPCAAMEQIEQLNVHK